MAVEEAVDARVTADELAGLRERRRVLAFHQQTVNLLQSELNLFVSHLLTTRGLDPSKEWAIDDEGNLTERE